MPATPTHTPTPWILEDAGYGYDILNGSWGDPSHLWIGSIHNSHDKSNGFPTDEAGKANAIFIVRVANNYEVMVNLLRKFYSDGGASGKIKGEVEEAFKQAGEVL